MMDFQTELLKTLNSFEELSLLDLRRGVVSPWIALVSKEKMGPSSLLQMLWNALNHIIEERSEIYAEEKRLIKQALFFLEANPDFTFKEEMEWDKKLMENGLRTSII